MFLVRLLAIARKELRHIYRDPQILFMAVLAPALVLFLLAYVFAMDAGTLRIAVLDLDRSATSRQVPRTLAATGEIIVIADCRDYAEGTRLLTRGRASAVVVIPHGFGESVAAGRPISLQAVLDGSDYNGSRVTYASLSARVEALGLALRGTSGASGPAPLAVQTRTLYNATGKWVYAMVPGLMAAAFCFPAIAVALACTRETERGSYESLLFTPLGTAEYLLGKLCPYLAAGLLSAVLTWALARLWFHVPFRSTLSTYLVFTLAFLCALMSVSILVGATASAQRHAIIIIVLIFFIPTFFMSGLLVPLDPERPLARILKLILPAANYVVGVRAVFLKGVGLSELTTELASLLRIALVALLASYLLARRKVA
jgi:ABC-2 type transport system permease protein